MSSFQRDYGYLNARLRGRWGAFYAPSFFDSMAEGDLHGLEQAILKGPYAPHYRRELATANSSILGRLERATTSGASERLRSVYDFSSGEARELIPILSIRGDIFNSRILLRRFHRQDRRSGIPQWHDYGSLGAFFFESIWEDCESPKEAIERCYSSGKPTAVPLAHSLESLVTSSDFMIAERCYMSEIISWCLESLKAPSPGQDTVREFLGRLIDLWNVQIWFKKTVNPDNGDIPGYLDGGTLTVRDLSVTLKPEDLFSGSVWRHSLHPKGTTFSDLGRRLQMEFFRWQMDLFRLDILGMGVPVAYMARQLLEWRNMEILAVGLSAELPADKIRKLLWII